MTRPEQKKLLDDVFAESSPPDFRAALLAGTLRQARRRRHWRQARSAAGALAVLLLAGILTWPRPMGKIFTARTATKFAAPKKYQLVETQPLPAGATISTRNLAALKMVSTAAGAVEIATRAGGYHLINDEQLLALLGGSPAALIRTGPDSEELVFANPEDRRRLLGN
jgi:hypothetical protein